MMTQDRTLLYQPMSKSVYEPWNSTGNQCSAVTSEYSTMGSTAWFTNSAKKVYLAALDSVL